MTALKISKITTSKAQRYQASTWASPRGGFRSWRQWRIRTIQPRIAQRTYNSNSIRSKDHHGGRCNTTNNNSNKNNKTSRMKKNKGKIQLHPPTNIKQVKTQQSVSQEALELMVHLRSRGTQALQQRTKSTSTMSWSISVVLLSKSSSRRSILKDQYQRNSTSLDSMRC